MDAMDENKQILNLQKWELGFKIWPISNVFIQKISVDIHQAEVDIEKDCDEGCPVYFFTVVDDEIIFYSVFHLRFIEQAKWAFAYFHHYVDYSTSDVPIETEDLNEKPGIYSSELVWLITIHLVILANENGCLILKNAEYIESLFHYICIKMVADHGKTAENWNKDVGTSQHEKDFTCVFCYFRVVQDDVGSVVATH